MRFEVKVTLKQVFHFSIDASDISAAQEEAMDRLADSAPLTQLVEIEVLKGVDGGGR